MSVAELTMITLPSGSAAPAECTERTPVTTGRVRAALRTMGWWIVDGLATDNGWAGGISSMSGGWVPSAAYAARIAAQPGIDARLAQRGIRRD